MNKKFTQGFKEQAVQKALTRGTKNLELLAQELSVGYSTLQKWIREYKALKPENAKIKRVPQLTLAEQFQSLMDTALMDEEQRSEYCRKKGLYPHQLEQWQRYFVAENTETTESNKIELKRLKTKNAALEKDLQRKEKALAETAALLVLQKKFQALLEDEEL